MKNLLSSNSKVNRVNSENGDLQFDSTGNELIDLIAKGADSFIERNKPESVTRFVELVNRAYNKDKTITEKIARYFLDSENGQNLKEQTPLLIAVLNDKMSYESVMRILTINPVGHEGAISPQEVEYTTLIRILSWHHYLNGRNSKLSFGICRAFAEIINNDPNALSKVYQLRSKNFAYDSTNDKQVGIIDILGIIRNFPSPAMPKELKDEYNSYFWPRYRGQKYAQKPTTALGIKLRQFFKNELPSGEVPYGVNFAQVLSTGNKAAIRKMMVDGRLSNTQIKLNLNTAIELLTDAEIDTLLGKRNFNLFPHEIVSLASAFFNGTQNTKSSAKGVEIADIFMKNLLKEYSTKKSKNVLFLGDTSGSMVVPLSTKSSVDRATFSAFVSYLSAYICAHRTFGIWDNDARLFKADVNPNIKDFLTKIPTSNANTDVNKTIKTIADFFSINKDKAPDTIVLISDMQFDSIAYRGYTPKVKNCSISDMCSAAIEDAKNYYKQTVGKDLSIVYWNVNASTSPSIEQYGILNISGFSANTISDILFINEQNKGQENMKVMKNEDILSLISERYR